MERNMSVRKFAAMSYYEDDYDELYEEYYIQYEEEEIFDVDGGIPIFEDDEVYFTLDREDIRSDSPIVKKDLTKLIKACENMPCCYKEYLTLGNNIGPTINFKEYVYLKYGFWP